MNPNRKTRTNLFFFFVAGTVCLGVVIFLFLQGRGDDIDSALGEGLGPVGLFLLVFVYARTAFKLLVRKESFWARLAPFNIDYGKIKTASGKILFYLNKSHPYLGVASIAVVYSHCYLISRFYNLLPLRIVLALLAWQGVWGLVLKTRTAPPFLKKRGHLFHSQWITGLLILIFAGLGHYLLMN
ncbi:MAG: hypothetical protein PHI99_03785 [Syntrophales bacterium]|nr:hypothetical protein [Syntrophales bacterium]